MPVTYSLTHSLTHSQTYFNYSFAHNLLNLSLTYSLTHLLILARTYIWVPVHNIPYKTDIRITKTLRIQNRKYEQKTECNRTSCTEYQRLESWENYWDV